jgi:hypothetical protein
MNRNVALSEILLAHLRIIDPHWWPGADGLTLDVVLKSYAQMVIAGQVPGKYELLRLHRELAAELEAFFDKPEFAPTRREDPVVSPLHFAAHRLIKSQAGS